MTKKPNTATLLLGLFLCVVLLIIAIVSLKNAFASEEDEIICVPRIAGSYIPLNEGDPALIVFDLKNPMQNHLFREVNELFQDIPKNG